jgi:hypothetical protein
MSYTVHEPALIEHIHLLRILKIMYNECVKKLFTYFICLTASK